MEAGVGLVMHCMELSRCRVEAKRRYRAGVWAATRN